MAKAMETPYPTITLVLDYDEADYIAALLQNRDSWVAHEILDALKG